MHQSLSMRELQKHYLTPEEAGMKEAENQAEAQWATSSVGQGTPGSPESLLYNHHKVLLTVVLEQEVGK